MQRTTAHGLIALAALGFVVGCDSSDSIATPISGSALQDADVAMESDLLTEEIVQSELLAMETSPATRSDESVTTTRTFSGTRSCPLAGQLSVEGSIVRSFDPATGEMNADLSGSRQRVDCTFASGEFTITVDGSSSWSKQRRRVDGFPDGLQTSSYSGSWLAVRSDGEERSCSFDYTVVRDPAERTITINGTICNEQVRRQLGWNG